MRYRIVARVIGDIIMDSPVTAHQDDVLFEFILDQSSRLSHIAASIQIPEASILAFGSTISRAKPDVPVSIVIGGDRKLRDYLIERLQTLEAHLSFSTSDALHSINLLNLEEEFLPESPEEAALIVVSGVSSTLEYPQMSSNVSANALSTLVTLLPQYASLTIPKSFFQQGIHFFRNFQYVLAYYHFFFVIEDFYAGGKTGGKGVLTEFSRSQEFLQIAIEAFHHIHEDERHYNNLVKLFEEEECELSPHGLQKLLYHIRGNLHHYHSRSPKTRGTPFNHAEYESIAWVSMYIANRAIGLREVAISKSLRSKTEGE